jgi:hypothetical protein
MVTRTSGSDKTAETRRARRSAEKKRDKEETVKWAVGLLLILLRAPRFVRSS